MATSPKNALARAGLPTLRVGGKAYQAHVSGALRRQTGDLDLAIALKRGQSLDRRKALVLQVMHDLKYDLTGSVGTDFLAFYGSSRLPRKVDIFLDGVYDFDFRPGGTGLKLYVDDEQGRDLSREGLLLCKLIAARPTDRQDAAGLLLGRIDRAVIRRKLRTQVNHPRFAQKRLIETLRLVESMYAEGSSHSENNAFLRQKRKTVCLRAAALRADLEALVLSR
jgi:hypothetical protein